MTPDFPCILVTTDFSELGNTALPVAFRMAAQMGHKIVLAHVIEEAYPSPLYAHYYPTPSPDERERLRKAATAEFERLVPKDAQKIPREIQLGLGTPAAEICRIAKESKASLVVMSSHGRRGVKHLVLGSVAERVVRQAPCSVLVLRAPEAGS